MLIFTSRPGVVTALYSSSALPGSISLGNGPQFSERVIFLSIGYSQAALVQFQQSLGNAIYVNSFGDRMGAVRLRGMGFSASNCTIGGQSSGVEELLTYYANNRISVTDAQIEVRIGVTPINGFLISCDINTASPEQMTYQFELTLATLPQALSTPNGDNA